MNLLITPKRAQIVWREALKHLFAAADEKKILEHVSGCPPKPFTDLRKIYFQMLESLINRQGMANSIGDIAKFKVLLVSFDPHKVEAKYNREWQRLFLDIKSRLKPGSRMRIRNPSNYWVQFCKGALDSARYLGQFKNGHQFVAYVKKFANNPIAAPGLPMMIGEEVHGYGFPLACDFLKELGFHQFGKPDVHIKAILEGLGFTDGSDYQSFKALVQIAKHARQTVYKVDKALWLIGSGRLYLHDETFSTNRSAFIDKVRSQIADNSF